MVLQFLILIGSLLIAFGLSNYEGATVISNHSITYGNYTWYYKTIDLHLYLHNLSNTLNNSGFENILPNMPILPNTPNNADVLGWVKFIGSIMLSYVANWIIYIIDWIILVPLKLLLFPAHLLLTIIGLNTSDSYYIKTISDLYNWTIPYIPYFS